MADGGAGRLTPDGYRPRLVEARLDALMAAFGCVEITGAKWCGKTWTALSRCASVTRLDAGPEREAAELDPSLALVGEAPPPGRRVAGGPGGVGLRPQARRRGGGGARSARPHGVDGPRGRAPPAGQAQRCRQDRPPHDAPHVPRRDGRLVRGGEPRVPVRDGRPGAGAARDRARRGGALVLPRRLAGEPRRARRGRPGDARAVRGVRARRERDRGGALPGDRPGAHCSPSRSTQGRPPPTARSPATCPTASRRARATRPSPPTSTSSSACTSRSRSPGGSRRCARRRASA